MRIVMKNPMNRSRTLLALALGAALVSTVAIAQQAATTAPSPPAADAPPPPPKLDANGDGVIDRAEAAKAPRLAQQFDQLDKNHDGKLSADERPRMPRGPRDGRGGPGGPGGGMHDRMMQLDTDHDGRVSRAEAAAKPDLAQRFDKLDANHDGFLDRSDFQAHMQQKRDECFAKADADKDGKLSRAEFDAAKDACRPQGGMRGPRGGEMPPPPPPAG
jgi:Ca2+-binding EF-hand superfamily protein